MYCKNQFYSIFYWFTKWLVDSLALWPGKDFPCSSIGPLLTDHPAVLATTLAPSKSTELCEWGGQACLPFTISNIRRDIVVGGEGDLKPLACLLFDKWVIPYCRSDFCFPMIYGLPKDWGSYKGLGNFSNWLGYQYLAQGINPTHKDILDYAGALDEMKMYGETSE